MEAVQTTYFGKTVFQCPYCGKMPYETFHNLNTHVKREHEITVEPVGEIITCEFRFCCNFVVKTHPRKKYCCVEHGRSERYYRKKIPWERKTRDKEEYNKRYYQENKKRIKEYSRKYYQENRERIIQQAKEYNKKNRERINFYKRKCYFNKTRVNDNGEREDQGT